MITGRGYNMTASSKKQKKTTAELLAELRATGFTPFIDNFKDAEVVAVSNGGTVREVGKFNTMRLAKYLVRQ